MESRASNLSWYLCVKTAEINRKLLTRDVSPLSLKRNKNLSQLRNYFIANIHYAFQDSEYLYLAVELVQGADLGYHMRKKKFKEEQAKFIMASIIMGLEYLHNNNIIHRNLTPSNVLFDKKGYVKISDFLLSRQWEEHNASETSGIPGYMAPEIMSRQNYGYSSDYFSLGVIGYQLMLRKMPYQGLTRKEIINQIKRKQIQLKKHEIPEGWSLESADFVNKCLQRKPNCRLGLNGPMELKQHVWLRDFDWQGLLEKEIPANFIPKTNLLKKPHKRINIKNINCRIEYPK